MIEVQTNIQLVVNAELNKLKALKSDADAVLRTVALTVLPEMKKRVHVDGKDSNGKKIGTYSPEYMKVRTGNYANAAKVSRGANKGNLKNAGTFTKGTDKAGLARPRYNRTSDTTVVLSLTRQMENDLSVVDTAEGYGIGYLNPLNLKKALWCETTYAKPILTQLSEEEKELAVNTAQNFLPEYFKNLS